MPDILLSGELIYPLFKRYSLNLFRVIFLPSQKRLLYNSCFRSTEIFSPFILSIFSSFNKVNFSYSNEFLGRTTSSLRYVHLLIKLTIKFSALFCTSIFSSKFHGYIWPFSFLHDHILFLCDTPDLVELTAYDIGPI